MSLIHNNERMKDLLDLNDCFECTICSEKCTTNTNLKQHMRVHTNEQLFKCTICTEKFCFSKSLKKHMLIHTGIYFKVRSVASLPHIDWTRFLCNLLTTAGKF